MKVLVTGGCGFLGTNLCIYYKKKGWDVIAYDNLAKHEFKRNPYMKPEARDYNKNLLEKIGVQIVIEDIRDELTLFKYTEDCDYICHTAAQPAMTISLEDPELDYSTNTTGTFNVLEAARKRDIPVAICSSIHTYGPDGINSTLMEEETRYVRNPIAINEKEPVLQGVVTPLHASKRCGEIYSQSYLDSYGLKVACFRLTGIYGPYQFGGEDHGWVANFSIRAVLNIPLTIYGSGKQLRDILYVSDVCKAFDAFYNSPSPGIYTLGGGEETMVSLIETIEIIKQISNKRPVVKFDKERFGDLRYFVSDYNKFNSATGWKPTITPKEGVSKLIKWIEQNDDLFFTKEGNKA
jgi:CDP-paratose 2-epimerase